MADIHSGSNPRRSVTRSSKICPLMIHVFRKISSRFSSDEIYSIKSGNTAHGNGRHVRWAIISGQPAVSMPTKNMHIIYVGLPMHFIRGHAHVYYTCICPLGNAIETIRKLCMCSPAYIICGYVSICSIHGHTQAGYIHITKYV